MYAYCGICSRDVSFRRTCLVLSRINLGSAHTILVHGAVNTGAGSHYHEHEHGPSTRPVNTGSVCRAFTRFLNVTLHRAVPLRQLTLIHYKLNWQRRLNTSDYSQL